MMHTVFDHLNTLGVYFKIQEFSLGVYFIREVLCGRGFYFKNIIFTKKQIVSSLKFTKCQQLRRQNIDQITENSSNFL